MQTALFRLLNLRSPKEHLGFDSKRHGEYRQFSVPVSAPLYVTDERAYRSHSKYDISFCLLGGLTVVCLSCTYNISDTF